MTYLYSDSDLWDAFIQRRKYLAVFLSVTAAALAGLLTIFILYSQLPYKDPNGSWMIAVACIIVALYIIFSFPFMGICYKRCNSYCKMLRYISVGLKENFCAPFAGVEDWIVRDGVDVNVATFEVKNIKREETMLRRIYVDGEKEFPPFEEGDEVRFVSQGNLLLAYEIINHQKETDHGKNGSTDQL